MRFNRPTEVYVSGVSQVDQEHDDFTPGIQLNTLSTHTVAPTPEETCNFLAHVGDSLKIWLLNPYVCKTVYRSKGEIIILT